MMGTPASVEILGLYLIQGLGAGAIRHLVTRFGEVEEIYRASLDELTKVEGVSAAVAKRIKAREYIKDPSKEYDSLIRMGGKMLTYWDPEFPTILREIKYPPVCLYVLGQALFNRIPLVAVVGSRHPSNYGERVAKTLSRNLAKNGLGIVSGLAMGIDTCAHEGALMGGGYTVAVLGSGLDRIYPKSNVRLFGEIVQSGCVVSEFPLGTPPDPKNFPIRNRIISGLSKGVLVVEATKASGSLITAAMALEEGREVFAVPGSIESMKSTGCHYLIRQGAKLVEKAEDILEELSIAVKEPTLSQTEDQERGMLTEVEKKILEVVGDTPMHMDEIWQVLELDPGELGAILISMELKGLVKQLPGKLFIRSG
jgi:DNA processing protein